MFIGNVIRRNFRRLRSIAVHGFGKYNQSGLTIVKKNGKYGVANNRSQIIIPPKYESVRLLKNGGIIAYDDGFYHKFDKNGSVVMIWTNC